METFVQLIFIIALIKYCLRAVLSGRLWLLSGYAVLAAVVALAFYPVVIEQPLTIIPRMLADKETVTDTALLTAAEAIAGILISVYLIDNYFRPKIKRTRLAFFLKIIPGPLVFCAIGYFELLFFKFRAGGDFIITAILFASLLFTAIMIVGLSAKYALKGESLKLEVTVIFNMAILVVGLLISSSVADYNVSHAQAPVEWEAFAVFIISTVAFVILGKRLQNVNLKNILKKQ